MLRARPPLALCKATGVVLGAGSRVVVMRDAGGVGASLVERLTALGVEVLSLEGAPTSEELVAALSRFADGGPVHGVFWLPALDVEEPAQSLGEWREQLRLRVKLLADAMRALYEVISTRGTFLVAATRLGGAFGYGAEGATAPLGGAVSGFVKAYARERDAALVKVVDAASGVAPATIAARLVEEALFDPGAVEIGYSDVIASARVTVTLELEEAAAPDPAHALGKDSVFVVSGAAGSIVSAITADLARRTGGTFHLLDLAPEPDESDPDLTWIARDREGLKRDLIERAKARGERATPALVERELAAIERRAAALEAVRAIRSAGGTAHYHSVDLTDAESVARALQDARAGAAVDVLLHAAGLEISRPLGDKSKAEFDRVFDVKADGFFNLVRALHDVSLGAVVAFSSIAGRFGNAGQTDYSAANDLLCKLASSLGRSNTTRGIAIDWTAWAGIGMASRGSIPQVMAAAGIDMLPPEHGVPIVHRELAAAGKGGEVVIGGRLGALFAERDETGGLDSERANESRMRGPMIGRVLRAGVAGPVVVETELDPKREPFLDDHRIDGIAVLPGVMGMEGFAELAALFGAGPRILEDVEFRAPFKFYRDEPRVVRLEGEFGVARVRCRLVGARELAGRGEAQITEHFVGDVVLASSVEDPLPPAFSRPERAPDREARAIYQELFHGPAYRVLDAVWVEGDVAFGAMREDLGPNHTEGRGATRIEPRAIELCFQTAGVWQLANKKRMGLPRRVERVRVLGEPGAPPHLCRTEARADGGFDAAVRNAAGEVWLVVRGYHTVSREEA
ncbi:MAG: SDR family oxidoreductase [Polyangiaceae bacterium]